ncbi:hypothetical protein [Sulfurimonas sp.]|jgi:hypothetical protein|uniref:hypothetical protein n=1 Tax=Sulfurimonas sp. TaxID=2022749 RepID=UPI0025E6E51B|nr:hypothetical protein [Sulfurimonas sp.]MBT5933863.1 hypothetical protein [Sulfurimonas sp.]
MGKADSKYQEVLDIEIEMNKIQAKTIITPKQYTEIYNLSVKLQGHCRNRIKDPLPYYQEARGEKITYYVEEVDKWRSKQRQKKDKIRYLAVI